MQQVVNINPSPLIVAFFLIVVSFLALSRFFLPENSYESSSAWSTMALISCCSALTLAVFYIGFIFGRTVDLLIDIKMENLKKEGLEDEQQNSEN